MHNEMDAEILQPQDWSFPVPIAYGPGRIQEMGARCQGLGISNPLIVTDKGSQSLAFIGQLQGILAKAGIASKVFADVSPNPRDDEIGSGCAAFHAGKHDAIIAIGGGSAMDGGKLICLTANNDLDIWAFEYSQTSPEISKQQAFPALITIPTTAGTGAETESTAMVTHVAKGMKFCVWHEDLKPSLALLDPELTVGLPPNLTAWTGMDAMVHAMEAYLVPGFHPMCDAMALEGLSLVSKWLPVAVQEPENLAARGGMLVGSCLAGIAFLKGLGLVHAISHMVGAEYNTQHGLTNAIILPTVLRFNLPDTPDKAARMAQVIGLEDQTDTGIVAYVEGLLDELGIPKGLNEIGVEAECVDRIAQKALLDSAAETNPRPASLEQMRSLVLTAIDGAR